VDFGLQNELKINLMDAEIRNPQSGFRNPQSAIRNPQSAIHNPQSAIAMCFKKNNQF
jgi:hypothetical protein